MTLPILSPSILSADFLNLNNEINEIYNGGADWIHYDVMDGHFVPNISIGIPVLKSLKKYKNLKKDVHLMITKPENFIDTFVKAGADIITLHIESTQHIHRNIWHIKSNYPNVQVGIALNPATPLIMLNEIINDIDLILIMSVNPGFGGQNFINNSINKIKKAKELIGNRKIHLQVDGGIKIPNVKEVLDAGANNIVSGSGIFDKLNPLENTKIFRKILNNYSGI